MLETMSKVLKHNSLQLSVDLQTAFLPDIKMEECLTGCSVCPGRPLLGEFANYYPIALSWVMLKPSRQATLYIVCTEIGNPDTAAKRSSPVSRFPPDVRSMVSIFPLMKLQFCIFHLSVTDLKCIWKTPNKPINKTKPPNRRFR